MPRDYNTVGFEALSITDSAGALTSLPSSGRCFVGTLETAQARARGDGTNPTTTVGVPIDVGDQVALTHSELLGMKFIRTGSTSGKLSGHYFDVELAVVLGA